MQPASMTGTWRNRDKKGKIRQSALISREKGFLVNALKLVDLLLLGSTAQPDLPQVIIACRTNRSMHHFWLNHQSVSHLASQTYRSMAHYASCLIRRCHSASEWRLVNLSDCLYIVQPASMTCTWRNRDKKGKISQSALLSREKGFLVNALK